MHPTEIATGTDDNSFACRIGNSIRARGIALDFTFFVDTTQGAPTYRNVTGDYRIRVVVARQTRQPAASPASTNLNNNYPDCFYTSELLTEPKQRLGQFPRFRKDGHLIAAQDACNMDILWQKEITITDSEILNQSATTNLEMITTGSGAGVHHLRTSKAYQTRRVKKFIPLDHEVKFAGTAAVDVREGAIAIFITQNGRTPLQGAGYGNFRLYYFGEYDFLFKDG